MEPEPGLGGAAGDAKPKATKPRATKTPLQKEVLEASYQLNQHPSMEHRKALGDRIGLTEQEVQAWFTNRRRRDKLAEKKAASTPTPEGGGSPGAAAAVAAPAAGAPAAAAPTAAAAAPAGGATPGSAKPKAPRAPRAPKASPGGAVPALGAPSPLGSAGAPGAAAAGAPPRPPILGMPGAPPVAGAPAGLAMYNAPVPGMPSGSVSAAAGSAFEEEEDETEDADEDSGMAAAWEGINALCQVARATLPVPFREDGPPLGFLFDEAPVPGERAGGGGGKRRRIVLGHDMVAEADEEGVKSVLLRKPKAAAVPSPVGVMTPAELEMRRQALAAQQQALLAQQAAAAAAAADNPDAAAAAAGRNKLADALAKEQDRLRRELLKQQERLERDRKREEDERGREMERHERERKKMQDKMEKERAKEEARRLKEVERLKIAEERELRRLEAAREKERKAEERRRAVEERKREKDAMRALKQQENAVLRQRNREGAAQPPDDEELEYQRLLVEAGIDPASVAGPDGEEEQQAGGAGAGGGAEGGDGAAAGATPPPRKRPRPDLPRPEFPPPSLGLFPAWPEQPAAARAVTPAPAPAAADGDADMAEAAADAADASATAEGDVDMMGDGGEEEAPPPPAGLDPQMGSELLVCWSFLQSFSDLFGLSVPSLEGLLEALAAGEESRLLADVHCALLRLLQADMEDAHDEKERVGRQTAAAPNFMDRSVVGSARRLEEAWAWGFDVDTWRAHLNAMTWPEVLRQMAIVMGRGRPLPRVRRSAAESKGPRIQGLDGEDVLDDGSSGGALKLRMPLRYTLGTVKAAAWQVLSTTGPSGLSVGDLVRRIQKAGFREMRSSKTPEAVVAGSLARDVLFTKVAPATWALSAVVAFAKRRNEQRRLAEARIRASKGDKGASGGGAAGEGEGGEGEGAKGEDEDDAEADGAVKKEPEGEAEAEAAATEAKGKHGRGRSKKDAAAATKQEPGAGAVKAEPADGAAAGPAKTEAEEGGAASMDVDGGAGASVKQEPTDAVKQEPGAEQATGTGADGAADGAGTSQAPADGGAAGGAAGEQHEEEEYSGDEEEEQEEEPHVAEGAGDPWVAALLADGYGSLDLRQRLEALSFVCHAVLDGPTLRAKLEMRTNEAAARRKAVFDQAKSDKRRRQEEAAARAAAAAEEARKRAEAAAAAAGAAVAAAGAAAVAVAPGTSRASTPAPGAPAAPGAPGAPPVDAKAIAGEIFGAAAAVGAAPAPPDPAKAAAEAARKAEEEEEERQKRIQRAEEIRKIDEDCAIRAEPLGSDRRHNRYWLFSSGQPGDKGSARLWVELAPDGRWQLMTQPEQLDALAAALEPKGVREGALAQALARHGPAIRAAMPGEYPLLGPTPYAALPPEERSALEAACAARQETVRLLAVAHLDARGDDYTAALALPEADGPRLQRLKRELLQVEAAVPADAVDEEFHRVSWVEAVQCATSAAELRTCLGQLEAALLPSHDGCAPGLLGTVFHRHPPLVRGAWVEVGKEVATALPGHASKEILPPLERPDGQPAPPPNEEPLAWLPPTLPAVALRLLALDASIIYRQGASPGRDCLSGYKYTLRPAPRLEAPPSAAAAAGGASGALPLATGGGAIVLTNVLADRGRVREAGRHVPDLPTTIMALAARDFSLNVEELRESVAEADRQGLLTAATAAGAGASGDGPKPGRGKGTAAVAAASAGATAPVPGGKGKSTVITGAGGRRSVVVVSGSRPPPPGGKARGAATKRGGAAGGRKGAKTPAAPRSKKGAAAAAAAARADEGDGEEDWAGAGPGAELGAPVLLGPEDEDDFGLSDDEGEEGKDDPNDSDYY
ncbi:hypothetical protein HYH03_002353 [Edaphochlamys debaryana]|uniref:Uncharacterized protein n=1 Tax=Edaphochlamys debaryana TaxID=47281 RepID=A0A835YFP6_9CHLO|nr:hypothetical protein HYH03_002353 [Edaphochlamys debaryana]|eukprot:KAG2500076.1 hypothetical protein HYH03_002353 [Edaphochlamys debaryana]